MKTIARFFSRSWKSTKAFGGRALSATGKTFSKIKNSKYVAATGNFVRRNWDTLLLLGYYSYDIYSSKGDSENAPAPDVAANLAVDSIQSTILTPDVIMLITNNIVDLRAVVNAVINASARAAESDHFDEEDVLVYAALAQYLKRTNGRSDSLIFTPDMIEEIAKESVLAVFPDNEPAQGELENILDEIIDVSKDAYEESGSLEVFKPLDFYCFYVNSALQ